MAAPMVRVTGWLNKLEWEQVYSALYSGDVNQQQHAVDKIGMWRCRLVHRMSVALECSSELMQAKLQRHHAVISKSISSQDDGLRLSHSLALVRFVNLLTDKSQTKMYSQPVHLLAEELGLPDWLVDLRHEATHSSVPSLTMLIEAVDFALQWLKTNYWEAQLKAAPEVEDTNPSEDIKKELSDILLQYMQVKFRELDHDDDDVDEGSDELKEVMKDFNAVASKNMIETVQILVEDGYLLPSAEQLEALEASIDLGQPDDDMPLPEALIALWKPILLSINSYQAVPLLLGKLAGELKEEKSMRQRLVAGWLIVFLNSHRMASKYSSRNGNGNVQDMFKKPFKFDSENLLHQVLEFPNCYTTKILNQLLPFVNGKVGEEQQKQLKELVKWYTRPSYSNVNNNETESKEHTLSELLQEVGKAVETELNENGETDKMRVDICKKEESQCDWKLADTNILWNNYPLGFCPGYTEGDWSALEMKKNQVYEREEERMSC